MTKDGLVDHIYEAALIPERWPAVLDGLAAMAGGLGTILFAGSGTTTRWVSSLKTEIVMTRFIADGWMSRNTRAARLFANNHAGFITDLDVYRPDELDRDAVYVEALRPMGVGWGAATAIPTPSGELLVFSIEREFAKGPVECERIAPLDATRPHLARAALVSARLVFERARAIVGSLEAIGLPAAVISSNGKTIAHNGLLASMGRQLRIGARDAFTVSDAASRPLFEDAVRRLDAPGSSGVSLPLPGYDGNSPAVIHVIPLKRDARDIFTAAHGLVVVNPIDRREVPSAEILHGLFDLSPAETRVARAFVAEKGIDAVAAALGLSRETVRTHLKALFAKTGRDSQTALLDLLAGVTRF